jgi:hypothetical protein
MKIDARTLAEWVRLLERAKRDTGDSDVEEVLAEVREAWLRAEREEAR